MYDLDDYLRYYEPKPGDTIVDLGAGEGAFGRTYADKLAGCKVYLIEAFAGAVQELRTHLSQCNIIHTLMGGEDGYAEYVITSQSATNYKKTAGQDVTRWGQQDLETVRLPVMKLNTLLETTGHVNFLKCDIEGSELEVFLNFTKPELIDNMAIGAYHIVNNNETWKTLKPFFKYLGYEVIHDPNFKTDHYEDMLYLKRK